MATENVIKKPKGAAAEYAKHSFSAYKRCTNGCTYCVSPDSLIFMYDGSTRKIDDVNVGDEVYGIELGCFNSFVKSVVLAKSEKVSEAYEVVLNNGTKLVCSAEHRWLTKRGWKYTIDESNGQNKRPLLTKNDFLIGLPYKEFAQYPITDEYRKGYLAGIIRGDANFKEYHYEKSSIYTFRLALKDEEAVIRTKEYLNHFGVDTNDFLFPMTDRKTKETIQCHAIRKNGINNFERIKSIIVEEDNKEWLRGFMAGIYDAEGYQDKITKRMYNCDDNIIATYTKALDSYGITYTFDKERVKKDGKTLKVVRITGGLAMTMKFVRISQPAILKTKSYNGVHLKFLNNKIRVVSIDRINQATRLVDIQTTTGNFFANGIVSHNCYLNRGVLSKALGTGTPELRSCFKNEDEVVRKFEKELKSQKEQLITDGGVFFSFITDPCLPETIGLTRRCAIMAMVNGVPVTILTKMSYWALAESSKEMFATGAETGLLCVGFTLTGHDEMEPNADPTYARADAMRYLHEKGIKTFASIEPIIDFDNSLLMIEKTIDFCDLYRIGLRSGVKADYYSNDKLCFFIGQVEGLIELKHSNAKVYWKESVRERVSFADPDYWTSRNNVSADYNIFKESI